MSDIRAYHIDGWVWLGVVISGVLYLITRKGKVGDCIRY